MSVGLLLLLLGCSTRHSDGYQGYVEVDFLNIAASQPGRLDSVAARKGATVERGAPLFYLDATVESAALRQAEQQLMAVQAQLADLQQGRRPLEIDVIKAQLAQATANEKLAQATLQRDEIVYRSGGLSDEQLDRARTQAEQATARVAELNNQLRVAALPAREDQVRAQTALVSAAQAAFDQAKWRLEQKAVGATEAGLIFDVLYEPGEWVPAGSPVVRQLPAERIKVRFFVPETEIATCSVRQAVMITMDGRVDAVPAAITYVSVVAEFTPPIIYSNDTRSKLVFMVEAQPTDPRTAKLNVGQPVSVLLQ
ncbi:MAG: HlyD family efflux transporter periplasmic adaptor subunit [bacterium]|nr:HlyD family efflux transporter periplasmic adaptor subunit [bacterium]